MDNLPRITAEGEPFEDETVRGDGTIQLEMKPSEVDEEEVKYYAVEILPENWTTVEVYRLCQFQISVGMSALPQGISALEVQAVCTMLGVPERERADVLEGVQVMSQEACRYMMDKAARAAKKRK